MTLISATTAVRTVPRTVREGVLDGLAETRGYLLSHHEPADHDRCYAIPVRDRRVRLCARCSGIYPGIAVGVALAYFAAPGASAALLATAVLPAPALVDWSRTAFTPAPGTNPTRTATGALLGVGYGIGLLAFLTSLDLRFLGVAIAYGGLAAALLTRERRTRTG